MSDRGTMGNTGEFILECQNIMKSFALKSRTIAVLNCINLNVARGQIYVITGRSGSGKSTLLGLMGGIERQTSGSIRFKDVYLERLSNESLANLRRKSIGIICQSHNLISSWTAYENVDAVLMHSGLSAAKRAEKIKSLLNEFGLDGMLDNLPSELSAGQQQRVAIARTLVNEPEIILADEPTGEVDSETSIEIIKHLFLPVRERHVALVVVTKGDFLFNIIQNESKLDSEMLPCIKNIFTLSGGTLSFLGDLENNKSVLLGM